MLGPRTIDWSVAVDLLLNSARHNLMSMDLSGLTGVREPLIHCRLHGRPVESQDILCVEKHVEMWDPSAMLMHD